MEKSNKRLINIAEEDGKVSFKLAGSFTAEDVVLICNTVILSVMNQLVNSYEKALAEAAKGPVTDQKVREKVAELKGMLYDFYNVNAANLLVAFAPEFEKNPDLTTQAILKAENDLIEEKYNELNKEGKIVPLKEMPRAKKIDIEQEES